MVPGNISHILPDDVEVYYYTESLTHLYSRQGIGFSMVDVVRAEMAMLANWDGTNHGVEASG